MRQIRVIIRVLWDGNAGYMYTSRHMIHMVTLIQNRQLNYGQRNLISVMIITQNSQFSEREVTIEQA